MKQTIFILCVIAFSFGHIFAQDNVKTNPIIFGEGYFGGAVAGLSGYYLGASFNYQIKNNLLRACLKINLEECYRFR